MFLACAQIPPFFLWTAPFCVDYTERLKSLRIHTQRITSLTDFYNFNVANSPVRYAINFDAVYNLYRWIFSCSLFTQFTPPERNSSNAFTFSFFYIFLKNLR